MTEETRGHALDALAKGMASGAISRRKALKALGAALLGGLAASIPGVAFASPCGAGTTRCGQHCCVDEFQFCRRFRGHPECVNIPIS